MSRDDRGDADSGAASNGDGTAFGAPAGEDDAAVAAASNGDPDRGVPPDDADYDPTVEFARALGVGRNVKWAVALGAAFAALLYVVFVVVPAETTQSPVLYLALAFVVFFATSLLLAILFTLVSAWRLSREL